MKKVLLATVACSGIIMMFSCKPSKDELRKNFISKCSTSIPATVPKDIADEYCNCSADALLKKYSVDEIAAMEKKIMEGDQQIKNKMMEDVRPCLMTLMEKAQAQQQH